MSRAYKLLIVVLFVLVLAALVYQAYKLNQLRLGEKSTVNKSGQATVKQPTPVQKQAITLEQLARENLMGNPSKAVEKQIQPEKVPETPLKLVLLGTINQTDGGKDSALIQGSNNETKRYFVGDVIEGNVTLNAVSVASVALKRGDRLETLRYPENISTPQPGGLPTNPIGIVPPAAIQVPQNVRPPIPVPPPSVNVNAGDRAHSPQDLRDRLGQAILKKPQDSTSGQQ